MYIVNVRKMPFGGYETKKFEMLDEAQELVRELFAAGYQDVILSQEIPMKVTVSVEF